MPSIPGYVRLFLTHLSLPSRYTYAQHTWSCSLLSPPSPYTAFMQSPYPRSMTSCTLLPVTAGLVVRVFCLLFIFNVGYLTPLCRGHKRCFVYRRGRHAARLLIGSRPQCGITWCLLLKKTLGNSSFVVFTALKNPCRFNCRTHTLSPRSVLDWVV